MKRATLICSILSLVILSGCSSHQSRERSYDSSYDRSYSDRNYSDREVRSSVRDNEEYATVTDIDLVTVDKTSGGGAVLGAVIGGVLGHQLGSGKGNDLATGAGAIGGAVAGNQIEKNRRGSDDEIYRITVRFPDGSKQKFDYADINGLREGDRVRVEGGQLYRL